VVGNAVDAQGLLQKKGALMMIWKKSVFRGVMFRHDLMGVCVHTYFACRRYYVVTDSQDMLQLASNESEAAVTLHVPLWSSQVVVTLATHADIPTGCLGVVIKHAVEDVVASASPIGPAANSHTKPIVLACEKEDVPIWSSLWKPVFDDVMYPDRSDSTEVASKATAVSVFLAVLAANHSRYRILIRSDRLMEAVSRGIPPELRGEFWSVLCNVDGRKAVRGSSQLTGSKSLYERLSSRRPPPGSLWHFAMNHALQNVRVCQCGRVALLPPTYFRCTDERGQPPCGASNVVGIQCVAARIAKGLANFVTLWGIQRVSAQPLSSLTGCHHILAVASLERGRGAMFHS
jgi:hypothetical protein